MFISVHTFMSWFSAFLIFILLILFPVRKLVTLKKCKKGETLTTVYLVLKKIHCAIGILAIPVIFIHCSIASRMTDIRSGAGALLLILTILLALSRAFKKVLGTKWKLVHQILAAATFVLLIYHCFIEFL
ncbi:MAG: hypothetical protein GX567_10140 [Clostridia bacterium]|nr:hypothetical protein [Clostridia bacterium]